MIKMELIIAIIWKNSEATYQISVDGCFTKQQLKKNKIDDIYSYFNKKAKLHVSIRGFSVNLQRYPVQALHQKLAFYIWVFLIGLPKL